MLWLPGKCTTICGVVFCKLKEGVWCFVRNKGGLIECFLEK